MIRIRPDKVATGYEGEVGKVYGRREVIGIVGYGYGDWHLLVRCRCECGKEDIVRLDEMKRGKRLMCDECGYKHQGEVVRTDKERLYEIWRGMRKRCKNKDVKIYKYYGAKGIKVCDEWEDFSIFYEWSIGHGYSKGLSIDRIDNDGDYEPSNCRWVTQEDQVVNRRLQCNNKSGYSGIRLAASGRWLAVVKYKGVTIRLGTYGSKEEALEARNRYIKEHGLPHKIQEWVG